MPGEHDKREWMSVSRETLSWWRFAADDELLHTIRFMPSAAVSRNSGRTASKDSVTRDPLSAHRVRKLSAQNGMSSI